MTASKDDTRICSLLHDWLELYPTAMRIKDDDEFAVARQQLDDICYQIAAIPSAGAAGLAIKAFLRHWVEENELFPLDKAILEAEFRPPPPWGLDFPRVGRSYFFAFGKRPAPRIRAYSSCVIRRGGGIAASLAFASSCDTAPSTAPTYRGGQRVTPRPAARRSDQARPADPCGANTR